jgi:hypothetical protein
VAPALAVLLALLPRVAFAATPPDPTTLRGMLIDGPSGYTESQAAPDTIDGPFDAQTYVNASYSDTSEQNDIVKALGARGFLGGYGRTFQNVDDEAWFMEDVKAFPDNGQAASWWAWEKGYFHDPAGASSDVPVAIPTSFGNQYVVDGFYGTDIEFTKGAFAYSVVVGSYKAYRTDAATAAAIAEYAWAPAGDIQPAHKGAAGAAFSGAIVVLGTTAGAVAVIVLAAMLGMLILSVRRRRDYSARNVLSADGAYWWDGTGWQPTVRTP